MATLCRWMIAVAVTLAAAGCTSLPAKLARELEAGRAVEGDIHGSFAELDQYVFTYRDRGDFFDSVEVSLLAASPAVAAELANLRRHDRVRIEGSLADNRSAQPHVEVRSLEVVSKYEATPPIPAYEHVAEVPADLLDADSALFLVHAVNANGAVLVVEYEDVILPVYVRDSELTRGLARNDIVRLHYGIRSHPDRPVHLELAEVAQPVEVVDSITALHGRPADVQGALVLFPQSPQVRFNVFAVLQKLPGNTRRQFTLVNFDDPTKFEAIRAKLQAAWDAADGAVSGRNKLVSTKVGVRARGTFNQIDPGQANAQIVLDGPEAIEIIDL